ncbi:hypothetical protein BJ322DRAFT_1215624, partial [Thelephora terrestris]
MYLQTRTALTLYTLNLSRKTRSSDSQQMLNAAKVVRAARSQDINEVAHCLYTHLLSLAYPFTVTGLGQAIFEMALFVLWPRVLVRHDHREFFDLRRRRKIRLKSLLNMKQKAPERSNRAAEMEGCRTRTGWIVTTAWLTGALELFIAKRGGRCPSRISSNDDLQSRPSRPGQGVSGVGPWEVVREVKCDYRSSTLLELSRTIFKRSGMICLEISWQTRALESLLTAEDMS